MPHCISKFLLLAVPVLLLGCGGGGSGGGSTAGGGTTTTSSVTALGTVFAVAAGASHTVALAPKAAASGVASLWGDNTWGQLGDGTLDTPKFTPVPLKSSALPVTTGWKAVAAGEAHTLAIRSDGSLWTWGRNDNGQLGDGTVGAGRATPLQIGSAKDWLTVAAGDAHSVALEGTTSPQIMSWGRNSAGQLGLGTTLATVVQTDMTVPTKVTKAITIVGGGAVLSSIPYTNLPWTAIAAGGSHTLALRSGAGGLVFSWGDNSAGQLGQVVPTNVSVPTQIAPVGAGTLGALAIAAGRNHSLCILTDHTLYAWGDNSFGQIGDGTTSSKLAATQVGTDVDWFAVAAGGAHTLAIKQDQSLWAWGSNTYGQLGDNTTGDSLVPIRIGVNQRWLAVAAGRYHSIAIATDGTLWVWGRNAEGQLGLGAAAGTAVLQPTLLP